MAQVLDPSLADRAKSALDRHAWREAFELLAEADADADSTLTPDELELYAQAAWWEGKMPVAIEARERAYAAAAKAGRADQAVITAILLAHDNLMKNAHSVATAWLNRAERWLKDAPENPGHGWLAVTRALQASLEGNTEEGLAQAEIATDIASRFADRDLEVMALTCKGMALLATGAVQEAMAIMDEATVSAVSGELDPATAGGVYCATIGACASMQDWGRAADWTEAQDRWCERERINGYPGMCRLHRAEIKRVRGSWLEAEAEARRATDELEGFFPAAVGLALYELGLIKLRRGDLSTAEEALLRAHAYGRDPEPALSLVRLAEGKIDAANASITRAFNESDNKPTWAAPPGTELFRLSLLPARIEIALAAGDVAAARGAVDELVSLTDRFTSPAIRATAASALGAVLVAEGDPTGGAKALREGIQLWGQVNAPYEAARARAELATAYAAEGSPERAAIELQTARTSFERLGATLDLRRADEALAALRDPTEARPMGSVTERAVKTFVFTDIVDSTKLAELLGDEAWDKLIRWHDQTLRSLVAEHGGQEIKGTGDGFFLAFDDPDRAIECAIAIQRRLTAQRQAQGFAPAVRIGVHQAEANRVGLDYFGTGVNQAARVGGSAGGAEILVSAPTLARSRRTFGETGRQTVELKGISAPVEVVSIDWR
jgi:class 3 adenylate cyclase